MLLLLALQGKVQIDTHWIDTTTHEERTLGFFFTNRPLKKTDDGSTAFRNRWVRQTGNLYFSLYDFQKDSILLKYRATKTCDKRVYPTAKVDSNILYSVYDALRIKKGITELPPTVQVVDVTDVISWEDLPALGHDYLLRNNEIKSGMVKSSLKEED